MFSFRECIWCTWYYLCKSVIPWCLDSILANFASFSSTFWVQWTHFVAAGGFSSGRSLFVASFLAWKMPFSSHQIQAVPWTLESRHIVGDKFHQRMRCGSWVMNVLLLSACSSSFCTSPLVPQYLIILQESGRYWYCWWTKSCTTKDDDYPIIYNILTIPGGAGFLPSTVPMAPLPWLCFLFVSLHSWAAPLTCWACWTAMSSKRKCSSPSTKRNGVVGGIRNPAL